MPDPVTATPKPPVFAPAAPAWFGIDLRNLAGFDFVRGAKTIEQRIPAIVNDIAKVGRDIVCVLELPNPQVKNFTRRMAKAVAALVGSVATALLAVYASDTPVKKVLTVVAIVATVVGTCAVPNRPAANQLEPELALGDESAAFDDELP
ncbi:hypothetical protein [Aeromicrobium fastidiosum]|uniref:Uncharacterized protein n=1 Tax=Aeromicrobium fastidiosum TaxID=52699 RepID=A0A641ALU0_9ACTN|nr:hypothetical protein [Aeromicrobium fastidiosum]KAA1376373.1 hypothetical protein ESP62_013140 [Aeromicrobium fastidiosum]MBP2391723.1 hypothetical protein [Aeromicrobium fastidiosum]